MSNVHAISYFYEVKITLSLPKGYLQQVKNYITSIDYFIILPAIP